MRFSLLLFAALAFLSLQLPTTSAQTLKEESSPATIAARTAGLKKQEGFLPYYWDVKKGALLIELSPAARDGEFLYYVGMGSGVGSTTLFADRGSIGRGAVCKFQRVGPRVLVIAENSGFRAEHGSADLKKSVELSFPTAVLAALPVEAEAPASLWSSAGNKVWAGVVLLCGVFIGIGIVLLAHRLTAGS